MFTIGMAMATWHVMGMHVRRREQLSAAYGGGYRGGPNNDPNAYGAQAAQLDYFRFTAEQLHDLCAGLGLYQGEGVVYRLDGSVVVQIGKTTFGVMEALLITLHRMASASRRADQVAIFKRNTDVLSRAFAWVLRHYAQRYDSWIFADRSAANAGLERWKPFVQEWASASGRKGLLVDAVGFIDGTRFETSIPGEFQEFFYNGYICKHCVNALAVNCLCGLIIFLAGPDLGTTHDSKLLTESNFLPSMRKLLDDASQHYAYIGFVADSAFAVRKYIFPLFRFKRATADERMYNKNLTSLGRITVEWNNKEIKNYWPLVNNPRVLQINRIGIPVKTILRFAAFLSNCRTCIRQGNQISIYFGVIPPKLEWYLTRPPGV